MPSVRDTFADYLLQSEANQFSRFNPLNAAAL